MKDTAELDPRCSAFVEKVGLVTQADGLTRAAGRIFGLLLWEGAAVSFGDLAIRLETSRGSISSGVRLLEERGLIRRIARAGDRQDWFEMTPEPFAALLDGAATRLGRAGAEIATTLDDLPSGAGQTPRIQAYVEFYTTLERNLKRAADDLRGRH